MMKKISDSTLNIRISTVDRNKLKEVAKLEGTSVSSLLKELINTKLEKYSGFTNKLRTLKNIQDIEELLKSENSSVEKARLMQQCSRLYLKLDTIEKISGDT